MPRMGRYRIKWWAKLPSCLVQMSIAQTFHCKYYEATIVEWRIKGGCTSSHGKYEIKQSNLINFVWGSKCSRLYWHILKQQLPYICYRYQPPLIISLCYYYDITMKVMRAYCAKFVKTDVHHFKIYCFTPNKLQHMWNTVQICPPMQQSASLFYWCPHRRDLQSRTVMPTISAFARPSGWVWTPICLKILLNNIVLPNFRYHTE